MPDQPLTRVEIRTTLGTVEREETGPGEFSSMDRTAPAQPLASEIAGLNARLVVRGITIGAPELTDGGRWQVRIECPGEPAELVQGRSPGEA